MENVACMGNSKIGVSIPLFQDEGGMGDVNV
jgi:hypothetical protein